VKTNLKLIEEVVSFSLTEKQKNFFEKCVKDASEALLEKMDWRMKVADIAISLHDECFGEGTRWNTEEARILRSMFAREVGIHLRTLEQWMDVKRYVINQLPKSQTDYPFSTLYDVCLQIKTKSLSPRKALDKVLNRRMNPSEHRMVLIDRYSSNLLTSIRKFSLKGAKSEDVDKVLDRLRECLEKLGGDR